MKSQAQPSWAACATRADFDGTTDALHLKLLTRIGANPDGTKCSGPSGSHSNATGLRLYFDAVGRESRFEAVSP